MTAAVYPWLSVRPLYWHQVGVVLFIRPMSRTHRWRVYQKRQRHPTEASAKLRAARKGAHLQVRHLAAALGVHPRTVHRWEVGESRPSPSQWAKVAACLARVVPERAVELAAAAGVPSPIVAPPPVDERRIEEALMRAADLLDVSPRRVRAAVRAITEATLAAHGKVEDLARVAQEKAMEGRDGVG